MFVLASTGCILKGSTTVSYGSSLPLFLSHFKDFQNILVRYRCLIYNVTLIVFEQGEQDDTNNFCSQHVCK